MTDEYEEDEEEEEEEEEEKQGKTGRLDKFFREGHYHFFSLFPEPRLSLVWWVWNSSGVDQFKSKFRQPSKRRLHYFPS